MVQSPMPIHGERRDWNGARIRRRLPKISSALRLSITILTPTRLRSLSRMHNASASIEPAFESTERQHQASTLGMWVFLATEVMFFGGLFLAYTVYRFTYGHVFALASRHLDDVFGGVNTAV